MGDGGFGAKIMFTIREDIPIIGGVPVTETITTTWIIMAILIIGSIIFTRNLKRIPNGIQNIVETVVGSVYNLTETTMGSDKVGFAPYIGTLMMYLALANLAGLLGVRPPTADLNMTLSLALITFFMIHFNGIRRKGVLGYLKGFTEPFFLLTPINLIGEIATPISLSFRLFGNIVGGSIIMALVYSALAASAISATDCINIHMMFQKSLQNRLKRADLETLCLYRLPACLLLFHSYRNFRFTPHGAVPFFAKAAIMLQTENIRTLRQFENLTGRLDRIIHETACYGKTKRFICLQGIKSSLLHLHWNFLRCLITV